MRQRTSTHRTGLERVLRTDEELLLLLDGDVVEDVDEGVGDDAALRPRPPARRQRRA